MSDLTDTSPRQLPEWIRKHVDAYVATNGAEGHLWDSRPLGGPGPVPTLLLTTTGRQSRRPLTIPLIYSRAGEEYVIIASRGGHPSHPAWYHNLVANPVVEVQVLAERFAARARTAPASERRALWSQMRDIYPPYDDYQARAEREIPVVLLRRA